MRLTERALAIGKASQEMLEAEKVVKKRKNKEVIPTVFDGAGGMTMSLNDLGKIDLDKQRIGARWSGWVGQLDCADPHQRNGPQRC